MFRFWKEILAGVVILALVGAGIWFGGWLQKPTIEELQKKHNELAMVDKVRELQFSNTQKAYRKLAFEYQNEERLVAELTNTSKQLSRELRETSQELLVVSRSKAILEETLRGRDEIVETDNNLTVYIDSRKQYESGRIQVSGLVNIEKAEPVPVANTVLNLRIETSPVLVVDRRLDGAPRATLSFGDMPIRVDSLQTFYNIDDPIRDEGRGALLNIDSPLEPVIVGIAFVLGAIAF